MFSVEASDAIGLILLYLVVAVLVGSIVELINTFISYRARRLEIFFKALFQNSGIDSNAFYKAAVATPSLYKFTRPSQITPEEFSIALFAVLHETNPAKSADGVLQLPEYTIREMKERTKALPDSPLRRTLAALIVTAEHGQFDHAMDDVAKLRTAIEQWYQRALSRVNGWYKRDSTVTVFLVAYLIAIMFNMDAVAIINSAIQSSSLRAVIAAHASINPALEPTSTAPASVSTASATQAATVQSTPSSVSPIAQSTNSSVVSAVTSQIESEMNQLKLPIGWPDRDMNDPTKTIDINWWLKKLLGILTSAFALSQLALIESAIVNKFGLRTIY
jgi:hypothetical protein